MLRDESFITAGIQNSLGQGSLHDKNLDYTLLHKIKIVKTIK